MRQRIVGVAVASCLSLAGSSEAAPPEIYPLSQVRAGQTGYGLTTMSGTEPERFEFQVIGVAKNFLTNMDIILVKSKDPKLAVTGFWQGMSGSPLFIEGKVACAFSYGFRFNKRPIGGCTPLHYMQKEGYRSPRNLPLFTKHRSRSASGRTIIVPRAKATLREWTRIAPKNDVAAAISNQSPWLLQGVRPRVRAPLTPHDGTMVQASVPLALSGFSGEALSATKELFKDYPITPMQAGGTGSPNQGPTKFKLGASIAVQLIRGDMSGAATGTVSYVDGNRVLAFGHPLFQAGEIYAPVASSHVHTVIPSAMSAFVMAQPMRELGALVQDRQSTIMADTNLSTRMIPVDIELRPGPDGEDKVGFHVQVLDNRFFTGGLASVATLNAIGHFIPDRDRVSVRVESTVHLRGFPPLSFVDYTYSDNGARGIVGSIRGLRAIGVLMNNPFGAASIRRVEVKLRFAFGAQYGQIERLLLPGNELKPGQRNYVDVVMATYGGKRVTERIPVDVPKSLAGSLVRLDVSAGDRAGLDAAPPKTLRDLVTVLGKLLPGNVFAATLSTAAEGAAVDGKLIRDLPGSAADRLYLGTRTSRATKYRNIARTLSPANRVIQGSKNALIKVADR